MFGPAVPEVAVKVRPLLLVPLTVTTTGPVVAPVGTVAMISVGFQVVVAAVIPLNVTVPGVEPKFDPMMLTDIPVGPEGGDSLVMVGVDGVTVKLLVEVAVPDGVVTEMGPVVAVEETVAAICVELVTV
jgi:hypothetical protein